MTPLHDPTDEDSTISRPTMLAATFAALAALVAAFALVATLPASGSTADTAGTFALSEAPTSTAPTELLQAPTSVTIPLSVDGAEPVTAPVGALEDAELSLDVVHGDGLDASLEHVEATQYVLHIRYAEPFRCDAYAGTAVLEATTADGRSETALVEVRFGSCDVELPPPGPETVDDTHRVWGDSGPDPARAPQPPPPPEPTAEPPPPEPQPEPDQPEPEEPKPEEPEPEEPAPEPEPTTAPPEPEPDPEPTAEPAPEPEPTSEPEPEPEPEPTTEPEPDPEPEPTTEPPPPSDEPSGDSSPAPAPTG